MAVAAPWMDVQELHNWSRLWHDCKQISIGVQWKGEELPPFYFPMFLLIKSQERELNQHFFTSQWYQYPCEFMGMQNSGYLRSQQFERQCMCQGYKLCMLLNQCRFTWFWLPQRWEHGAVSWILTSGVCDSKSMLEGVGIYNSFLYLPTATHLELFFLPLCAYNNFGLPYCSLQQ